MLGGDQLLFQEVAPKTLATLVQHGLTNSGPTGAMLTSESSDAFAVPHDFGLEVPPDLIFHCRKGSISELPNICVGSEHCPAVMQEKTASGAKRPRAATKEEIREAIDTALRWLGLDPVRGSFNVLSVEVGVTPSALYNAWKGHKSLGPGPLHSLRRIPLRGQPLRGRALNLLHEEQSAVARAAKEKVDYIISKSSQAEIDMFLSILDGAVAAKSRKKA